MKLIRTLTLLVSASLSVSAVESVLAATPTTPSVPPPHVATSAEATLSRIDRDLLASNEAESRRHLQDVQQILLNDPKNVHARLVCGEVLANLGLQNFAKDQFLMADKIQPGAFIDEYHRAMEKSPYKASKMFFFAKENYPNDGAVLYQNAKIYMTHGMVSYARQSLEDAIKTTRPWPDAYAALGKLYLDDGYPGKAMQAANEELRLNPDSQRARRIKVLAEWRLGTKLTDLGAEVTTLLKERPEDPDLCLLQAQLLYDRGHYQEAVPPCLFALMQEDGGYTLGLSKALFKQLLKKIPETEIRKAIDKESPSTSKNLRRSLLRLRVAECYGDTGNHLQSSKDLSVALKMHEFFVPLANYQLGNEMMKLNNSQLAVYFYRTAAELRPDVDRYKRAADRATDLYKNRSNDIARRIKSAFRPG